MSESELKPEVFGQLSIQLKGNGSGSIIRTPANNCYQHGDIVSLEAKAQSGSRFVCWSGDVTGTYFVRNLRINSEKSISATFEKIPSFSLNVIKNGDGFGAITCSPDAETYLENSVVKLKACAADRSRFNGWQGNENDLRSDYVVTMNAEKSITAEFIQQKFFGLNITTTGTGSGTFTQSPDFDEYLEGSTVTLIAKAEEGSMFNGWQGDASGLDTCCTFAMDSAKSVTADFLKLDVPDLSIVVKFDSVEDANMQSGDEALILYFSIANNGQKQVCVELSLSSYITNYGEEIEQSVWLSGCLLGSKSSTLRAGTFRKMGLVFHKSRLAQVALGDDLHVTVFQAKPERRLSFTFRCIHKEPRQFTLIKAVAELTQALDQDDEVSLEKLEILQRLTLLEEGMRDILRRLDALQFAPEAKPVNKNILPEPTRTLPEVLSWLATQDRISMATLRGQLLPLDLLPSAVIDDINERAYDLAGEAALEDDGDAVLVQRDVLLQVLAAWKA